VRPRFLASASHSGAAGESDPPVTPGEAVNQAKKGQLLPVYLVAGEERLMRDDVVGALREASLAGGVADFNEDRFTAGEVDVETVISAARTVPMMARRRFVLVRGAERWDTKEAESSPFDRLAEYAAAPVDSTCLVITASKIDGRRKLALAARKQGFVVACDPLDDRALPRWIAERCAAKGHAIGREVAELLAALSGPGLSAIDDAIERLSLYVGSGAAIDEAAVAASVARVRTEDTWALVDAVGARDLGRALRTLADAYDPRERGLPLLGALAWSIRQLARYQAAVETGASPDEAARRAGVFQPNRARELATRLRAVRVKDVERFLLVLAETDLALKSSRRPPDAVLEEMLTRLCRAETRSARTASEPSVTERP
jgi:DNA polymerase-3 subunit delta